MSFFANTASARWEGEEWYILVVQNYIEEVPITIRQVWEYRKERGPAFFSGSG